MNDAFLSKRNSMPRQYRRAEARKAGQRMRYRTTGHHVGPTPASLVKPAVWKRPGYQLAAGAIAASALGGTMYSYNKGRKEAMQNPAPAMPVSKNAFGVSKGIKKKVILKELRDQSMSYGYSKRRKRSKRT